MALTLNRAVMTTTTTGTGTVTLGEAVIPFQSFSAASAINTAIYGYLIEDANGAWEIGSGVYTSSGTTLSRVLDQSSTGSLLSLSGAARVTILERTADLVQQVQSQSVNGLSTVTFSAFPSNFSHLKIIGYGRSSKAGTTADVMAIRFNSDTGANYEFQSQFASGTSPGVAPGGVLATGQTSAQVAEITPAGAIASYMAGFEILIPGYANTTFNKAITSHYTLHANGSAVTNFYDITLSAAWANTSAITRIDLLTSSTWVAGSTIALYIIP